MDILADVRFGARMLAKSPAFTGAAALAIGLGIGVNSMMFTVYNAALFKSLPFETPMQIVHIHSRNTAEGWDEVRRLDPDLPLINIRTLDEYIGRLSLETRIVSLLFSAFAAIGLALSALGIYAVTAYATSRRTQETGIRIALGATRSDVVRLVLRSGLRQLAVALPIGLAAALAVSRLFASVLFEVAPLDLVTFASIPVMLTAIVPLTCLIPARRAAQLSPVDALHTE